MMSVGLIAVCAVERKINKEKSLKLSAMGGGRGRGREQKK